MIQREIDRLQQQPNGSGPEQIEALLTRKMELIRKIEGLR
jgi:hypothetical protein